MGRIRGFTTAGILVLMVFFSVVLLQASPVSTAFTYQGRLNDNGRPADGVYDFQFRLFDAESGGRQSGLTVIMEDITVTKGLFTIPNLDFGSGIFNGEARWLEIGVRPGGETGAFTVFNPLQPMTATPYAVYALNIPAGLGLGDITAVLPGIGLSGGGSVGDVTLEVNFGGTGSSPTASRSDHDHAGMGDITGVTAGAGMGGGGTLGDVTLAISFAGTGLADQVARSDHHHDPDYVNVSGDSMSGATTGSVLSITNSGTGNGLHATSLGYSGNGVYGVASGDNGRGVYGQASGPNGHAVHGVASFTEDGFFTGATGGYFESWSAQGRGVAGFAKNSGNFDNTGGYFESWGEIGRGVVGIANGASGRGVYGQALNAEAIYNYGGFFIASGTFGIGAFGGANGIEGKGVYGQAYNGTGVFGLSTNGTGVLGVSENEGGSFTAMGNNGRGVFGHASGSEGKGVYGYASNPEVEENYGGYFEAYGSNGTGVYAYAYKTGVYSRGVGDPGGIGVHGDGNAYDFYAGGGIINYGPFTGGHEVRLPEDFPRDIIPGLIVSVTGQTHIRRLKNGATSLSSTLPTVRLSSKTNDKAVFGVLVAEVPLPEQHWYEANQGERFATVNALGEGRVWVSNINGGIEVGDYITTSSIPGYGQKQDDDILHSYTLGKAIEAVDWGSVTETVLINGQAVKVYLIGVVYTSG